MKFLAKKINIFSLKTILKVHSVSYSLASFFSLKVEKGKLHPKHRIMNYHKFFVDNVSKNDRVLDIGCGNGALTYDIAKKAKEVIGIDLNCSNIQIAKSKYSRNNVKYICEDATNYLPEHKFDIVVLSNVLEHIENRIAFLKSLENTAPTFLIRVPMLNRDWITLYKKELGLEYRLDNTHFIEYTPESFEKELNKANFFIHAFSVQFGEIWAVVKSNNN